jgi:hemolysin III
MRSKKHERIGFGREPFNGYSHLFAAAVAVWGGVVLLRKSSDDPVMWIGCAIYSLSLFLAFFSSALFHLVSGPQEITRRLRDFDHLCIRGLIVGTYAPMGARMLPTGWAVICMLLMVMIATADAIVAVRWRHLMNRSRVVTSYSVLAALSLVSAPFCWAEYWKPILWTAFGSLFYIAGAICYVKKVLRKSRWLDYHEIWHVCVMVGALIHYLVILNLI